MYDIIEVTELIETDVMISIKFKYNYQGRLQLNPGIINVTKNKFDSNIIMFPNVAGYFSSYKDKGMQTLLKPLADKKLLVDVKISAEHHLSAFKSDNIILFESPYISTNASSMKLILFDLSNLK